MVRTPLLKLLGCASVALALAVHAQSNTRLREGDLVEFEGAYGAVIGEVISGPDPSIYYLLAIPGKQDFAIHREKLRVLQRAGAASAAVEIGAAVTFMTRAEVERSGRVVKVNGAWCQVDASPSAKTWIECRALRSR